MELPLDLAAKAGQRVAVVSIAYAAGYTLLYLSSRVFENRLW